MNARFALAVLFAAGLVLPAQAQQTYSFNRGYRPGHVYTSEATVSNDMTMGAPGGIGVMKGTTKQTFEMETRANQPGDDGSFDIHTRFLKGSIDIDMRGMKQQRDLTEELRKMTIVGTCSKDGTVESVDVTGGGVQDMLKQLGPQLLKDNQIQYPQEPMAVGDSFSQTVPLDLPMQGMPPIKGTVHSTFTLASVEGDLATFEVVSDMGLVQTEDSGDGTKLDGSGTGIIVYSFKDRFERSAEQNTSMKASVSAAGNAFTIDVTTHLEQTTTVSLDQ